MNDDMKELTRSAEEKGYEVVEFREFDHTSNNCISKRFSLVFEKKED